MKFHGLLAGTAALFGVAVAMPGAEAAPLALNVTLTNTSPAGGVGLSPLWVGFHNGSFDIFNTGSPASLGLEGVAEDGDNAAITAMFAASTPTGMQGTLAGGPAFVGAMRSGTFTVDTQGAGRYFSYASMVVVSNDFFVANGNPLAIDLSGLVPGDTLTLLVGVPFGAGTGGIVYDAGTEVNDFLFSLANGAFGIPGGQTGPNQGTPENGVVTQVSGDPFAGYLNAPPGFSSGLLNFNDPSLYTSIARIDIMAVAVPEPGTLGLMLGGIAALGAGAWRGRRGQRRTPPAA